MTIGALRNSAGIRQLLTLRSSLDTLQIQLSTGKKSESYAGLGGGRSTSLDARAKLSRIESYTATIEQVTLRTNVAQNALRRMEKIGDEQRAANLATAFVSVDGKQTVAQKSAFQNLQEVIGLLNQDVGGRKLFSGRAAEQDASVSADAIMNGSAGRAGLKDVIAERRVADGVGATGRLDATIAGAVVSLAREQVAGVPVQDVLGFSVAAISSTSPNVTATRTAGPPASATVDFTAQPAAGASLLVSVGLPDGRSLDLRFEATTDPATPGKFQLGATAADTAANFHAALQAELQTRAASDLAASSNIAASEGFFDISDAKSPLRVNADGTGLVEDPTGTLRWYTGDAGADSARGTAAARVDSAVTVGYGMRANERGFRQLIAGLAGFAAVEFDPAAATTTNEYRELSLAVRNQIGDRSGQTLVGLQSEIVVAQQSVKAAMDRHVSSGAVLGDLLSSVEDVSKEEVAAKILEVKTRLEASYQTTSLIAQMSLVNYLR